MHAVWSKYSYSRALAASVPLPWTAPFDFIPLQRFLIYGRTDKNLCRFFGASACRVFPDDSLGVSPLFFSPLELA